MTDQLARWGTQITSTLALTSLSAYIKAYWNQLSNAQKARLRLNSCQKLTTVPLWPNHQPTTVPLSLDAVGYVQRSGIAAALTPPPSLASASLTSPTSASPSLASASPTSVPIVITLWTSETLAVPVLLQGRLCTMLPGHMGNLGDCKLARLGGLHPAIPRCDFLPITDGTGCAINFLLSPDSPGPVSPIITLRIAIRQAATIDENDKVVKLADPPRYGHLVRQAFQALSFTLAQGFKTIDFIVDANSKLWVIPEGSRLFDPHLADLQYQRSALDQLEIIIGTGLARLAPAELKAAGLQLPGSLITLADSTGAQLFNPKTINYVYPPEYTFADITPKQASLNQLRSLMMLIESNIDRRKLLTDRYFKFAVLDMAMVLLASGQATMEQLIQGNPHDAIIRRFIAADRTVLPYVRTALTVYLDLAYAPRSGNLPPHLKQGDPIKNLGLASWERFLGDPSYLYGYHSRYNHLQSIVGNYWIPEADYPWRSYTADTNSIGPNWSDSWQPWRITTRSRDLATEQLKQQAFARIRRELKLSAKEPIPPEHIDIITDEAKHKADEICDTIAVATTVLPGMSAPGQWLPYNATDIENSMLPLFLEPEQRASAVAKIKTLTIHGYQLSTAEVGHVFTNTPLESMLLDPGATEGNLTPPFLTPADTLLIQQVLNGTITPEEFYLGLSDQAFLTLSNGDTFLGHYEHVNVRAALNINYVIGQPLVKLIDQAQTEIDRDFAKSKWYVYYELNAPDIEGPELIGTVDDLAQAWDLVGKQVEAGRQAGPIDAIAEGEQEPPWADFDREAKRDAGKSYIHTRFDIPKEADVANTTKPIWIAVAGRDTWMAFPRNWYSST